MVSASLLELSEDRVGGKGENLGIEHGSVLENFADLHLILERIDLQFIQKSGFGSTNLVTSGNDLLGLDDINLSLDNLGLDTKGLEESGLLRVETG